MYRPKHSLVIGFHGCDYSVCKKLVQGEIKLKPSNNSYDWLGNGIYFWENNHQRALNFAVELTNNVARKSNIVQPAVVGAILDLGFCLDLLDSQFISMIKESHRNLHSTFEILNASLPVNKNVGISKDLLLRDLDCKVINNLHLQRKINGLKPFDSVRSAFIEGSPLYDNAGFHEKNHIQLCICNPNCIKGYFLPQESNENYSVP